MPKHTTLRVHEALLRRAKAYAQRHDLTLTAVMEHALAAYLADPDRLRSESNAIELPSFGKGGLQPGIDLDDMSALMDVMDRAE